MVNQSDKQLSNELSLLSTSNSQKSDSAISAALVMSATSQQQTNNSIDPTGPTEPHSPNLSPDVGTSHLIWWAPKLKTELWTECLSLSRHPPIQGSNLDWSESIQGVALGAFYWGFILTHVLGGQLANIFSARIICASSILTASLLTLILPVAANFSVYAVIMLRMITGLCLVSDAHNHLRPIRSDLSIG